MDDVIGVVRCRHFITLHTQFVNFEVAGSNSRVLFHVAGFSAGAISHETKRKQER